MTYPSSEPGTSAATLAAAIFGHWVHSREEDAEGLEVFRPDAFPFPPSFGRDGLELLPDGTLIQDDIGPADGIVQVPWRWRLLGPRRVGVSFGGEREGYSFEIIDLDEDVLRIRRGAPQPQSEGYGRVPAMSEPELEAYHALPPAACFRRLDFEHADVVTLESFPPQFVLRVRGTKPYANMDVELVPFVYVRQPEYWEIEVVGSLRGFGLPARAPYEVSIPVTSTMGTRGIEVVGATRSERLDVPDAQAPGQPGGQEPVVGECRDWAAWVDREPPGSPTLHVSGECIFPTGGFTVELRRHEPQGINPGDLLLDKVVTPPSGPAATVVTPVQVRYSEEAADGFDTVTILPDGVTIPVRETR
jgi:hypothetical protein